MLLKSVITRTIWGFKKAIICTINKMLLSTYRLTSSADCAMKKPTVFEGSFVPLGLMEILLSFPSSVFTSIAKSNNFSFTKHSLKGKWMFL